MLAGSNGAVYTFGGAKNDGTLPAMHISPYKPVVGVAAMPTGGGYWMDASDGGVFTFGATTRFYGSMGGHRLAKPIVGMASTATGHGYWLVAADGGIFSFGNARFYGSVPGIVPHITLAKPIVGMATTVTGHGYWLVASDGGVFSFGAARFHGSLGGVKLQKPIVGMAAMPTGDGYWLVAADGGIFTFGGNGGNRFYGSLGAQHLTSAITGMASLPSAAGYWLTSSTGQVTNFGTAVPWGMPRSGSVSAPIVGIAEEPGNGDPGSTVYQAGSYGYDVSNWQCTPTHFTTAKPTLPKSHAIGVVEVEGASFGTVNPCLASEARWAAGGLSLYLFLSFPTKAGDPGQPTPASLPVQTACKLGTTDPNVADCDFGYAAAMHAYQTAVAVLGASRARSVPWFFDIEPISGFGAWRTTTRKTATPTTGADRSVVVGAFDALFHTLGMNTVGFYFNLSHWNSIVGSYDPPGLRYVAWWTGPSPATKCATADTVASRTYQDTIPKGPVTLVQYQSGTYSGNTTHVDEDYAC